MKEISSNQNDTLIDPQDDLNNFTSQNDFMLSNCPPPSNYNFQPLRDLPYLKDHRNVNALSKNILNNDETSLINKQKEI